VFLEIKAVNTAVKLMETRMRKAVEYCAGFGQKAVVIAL
jgi:hypothetical protein